MDRRCALSVVGCLSLALAANGGDLQPPAGPIQGSMKPLDAIEPRTCINEMPPSGTALHVITEPGSYYLAAPIVGVPGMDAIHVDLTLAPPGDLSVSIDLGSMSVTGVPGAGTALVVDGPLAGTGSLRLEGGDVGGWSQGVRVQHYGEVRISSTSIRDIAGDGVTLTAGDVSVVQNARITTCNGLGLKVDGVTRLELSKVKVEDTGGDGVLVLGASEIEGTGVVSLRAGGDGLRAEVVTAGTGEGGAVTLRACELVGSAGDGLDVTVDPAGTGGPVELRYTDIRLRDNFGNGGVVLTGPGVRLRYAGRGCYYGGNTLSGHSITCGAGASVHLSDTRSAYLHNGGHGHVLVCGAGGLIDGRYIDTSYSRNGGWGRLTSHADSVAVADLSDRCTFDENQLGGVRCEGGDNGSCTTTHEDCSMSGNSGPGSSCQSGSMCSSASRYVRCDASGNAGDGISQTSGDSCVCELETTDCRTNSNGGSGCSMSCGSGSLATARGAGGSSSRNASQGIDLSCPALGRCAYDYERLTLSDNGTQVTGAGIRCLGAGSTSIGLHCRASLASGNSGAGFTCADPGSSVLDEHTVIFHGCRSYRNAGAGFSCERGMYELTSCAAALNTGSGYRLVDCAVGMDGCQATRNSGHGVEVLRASAGILSTGLHVRVRDTSSSGNTLSGFTMTMREDAPSSALMSSCVSGGNGTTGFVQIFGSCAYTRCVATSNTCGGFTLSGGAGEYEECEALDNDCSGFSTSGGVGMSGTVLCRPSYIGCEAKGNSSVGFGIDFCGPVDIERCRAHDNDSHGIWVFVSSEQCVLRDTTCSGNDGWGVIVQGPGHTIVSNIASGNSVGGFSVPAGNTFGPMLTEFDVNTSPSTNHLANLVR